MKPTRRARRNSLREIARERKVEAKAAEVEISFGFGVDAEKEKVVLTLEATGGERPFKIAMAYSQEELRLYIMSLVEAGQKLEDLKPKPLIVLPGAV